MVLALLEQPLCPHSHASHALESLQVPLEWPSLCHSMYVETCSSCRTCLLSLCLAACSGSRCRWKLMSLHPIHLPYSGETGRVLPCRSFGMHSHQGLWKASRGRGMVSPVMSISLSGLLPSLQTQ